MPSRLLLLLAASLAAGSPARAGSLAPGGVRALVVVDPATPDALDRAADALEAEGAVLPHRFSDGVLVGTLPPGLASRLPSVAGVDLEVEVAGGPRLRRGGPPSVPAARAFVGGTRRLDHLPPPAQLAGDEVEPLPEEIESHVMGATGHGCDRPAATSAFMVGSVAVGILMPESAGLENTEDWDNPDVSRPGEDRRDIVVAEIVEGCDTLVSEHPLAGLSFRYEVRRDVPIELEPILHAVPDRGGWIAGVLEGIGHGAGSESAGTHGYARALRERLDTDWAAVAYVVDDLNDVDNGFPPTGFPFAYALLGGPYMVMTYGNDGWGIDRMDVVFRHELGHVFHALDEYTSAGNTCAMTAGYLRVANGNNASPPGDTACVSNVTCVMRGNTTPTSCEFTLGQVGIRDADADGIPDVRDVPPDSSFFAAGPLLVEVDTLTVDGRATGLGRAEESDGSPVHFSVNRVLSAEWSLDGGPWQPLAATDGTFGDRCEDVSVDLLALAEGWHDVLLRAANDVSLVEPSPASLRVYVNTDCADDAAEPDDDAPDGAVARPAGTYSLLRCAYDSDWSRFHLTVGAAVGVTMTQSDTSGSLRVRLLDPIGVELAAADASGGVATLSAVALRSGVHRLVVGGDSDFETAYQLDIAADCLDDPEEPDSPAPRGSDLGTGSWPSRVICAGDEDRYLVAVQAGETLSASITFDGALGDLDLELLDPAGAVAASSTGTAGLETVALTPTTEGVHVVRVFGKTPSDRNVHDLVISATGCLDDVGEEDDGPASARPLAAGTGVSGAACGSDEDWFAFTTAGRRLVRIQLQHDVGAGNLDLELRDPTGTRLFGRSTSAGPLEDVTTERLLPGDYLVRVVGTTSARVAYRLTLEDEDPILLFVTKDPEDALLRWNASSQECFTLRRHDHPDRRALVSADFDTATLTLIQEGDPTVPDGDRPIDDLARRERGVIVDGTFLVTWLVDPHDCGASLVASSKTAQPYPVLLPGIGTASFIDYTIAVANTGLTDAFGVQVTDDLPRETASFSVTEIPPGAGDSSQPAPAGANLKGQVVITGIAIPALSERIIRFRVMVDQRLVYEDPMVDNQAAAAPRSTPNSGSGPFSTDDPSTAAFGDDTRVFVAAFSQQLAVSAFWHADVSLDLELVDPCGNVLSASGATTVTCAGQTGNVTDADSCAVRSMAGRFEAVSYGGWPPPAGEWIVRVSHSGFYPDDPACSASVADEVTVIVQRHDGGVTWRTVTVEPATVAMEVLRFLY